MRRHSRRSLPIAFGLAGVTALTIGGIGVAHVSPATHLWMMSSKLSWANRC